ncbi:hypothetical protein HPP92_013061 [Vanilla planifolia]|uniref:Uncharacterized protein n=1 Tax=Vanilla planifolia TaxID=51239 RepID=A0A835QTV0_VANPL|nr:hypothetical protein HPP92_013061 [Vanilla planifolia]
MAKVVRAQPELVRVCQIFAKLNGDHSSSIETCRLPVHFQIRQATIRGYPTALDHRRIMISHLHF